MSPMRTANHKPRYGVVVVSWNNESLLADCFESVRAQTIGADRVDAYLVDNGSTDDSVALVRKNFPEVTIIEQGWNSLFAAANNVGIRAAFSDPSVAGVVLLNSDARLSENWFEIVGSFSETRPLGASFQALTRDHANPAIIDSHHLYVNRSLHSTQWGSGTSADRGFANQRVFGVNAAAALYMRTFFEAQPFDDLLDEKMGIYLEDVDVAARALMMGWENWFVAGTDATHMGSVSTNKQAGGFALRRTWRNQFVLLLTNFPVRVLLRGFGALVAHEVGAVRHLRATGRGSIVGELWRGRTEGIRLVPYALKRRRQLAPFVVADPEFVWELMQTGTVVT